MLPCLFMCLVLYAYVLNILFEWALGCYLSPKKIFICFEQMPMTTAILDYLNPISETKIFMGHLNNWELGCTLSKGCYAFDSPLLLQYHLLRYWPKVGDLIRLFPWWKSLSLFYMKAVKSTTQTFKWQMSQKEMTPPAKIPVFSWKQFFGPAILYYVIFLVLSTRCFLYFVQLLWSSMAVLVK